jgi:hypothetical protein
MPHFYAAHDSLEEMIYRMLKNLPALLSSYKASSSVVFDKKTTQRRTVLYVVLYGR